MSPLVTTALIGVAVFLLGNIAVGLLRVNRGPEPVDRMLAVQLLGTMGVAMALLFGAALGIDALLDVALVLAVLAALAGIYFARRFHDAPEEPTARDDTGSDTHD